ALAFDLQRTTVFSPNEAHRSAFSEYARSKLSLDVTTAQSVEQAVEGADVICTTTSSKDPIVKGKWISPGCHVNAVGSSVRYARELDTEAVLMSRLFVDRMESAVNEAGDFIFPKKEGALDETHIIGEVGDVLTGKIPGRNDPNDITLFKSLGLAVEDLRAAHYVVQRAKETGVGTYVDLGGRKHR
ncbi:MAG: ornithine cyclodeaminase family protein, partial [Gemmatimonadota bacterium]|nr:ornithine cyclodeaminase family protein [Gemmatimonadota bacterium]